MIGYTDQVIDEFFAVTGPFSELRDGMTPEQRAAADGKVQALAAQPMTYTLRLTALNICKHLGSEWKLIFRGVRIITADQRGFAWRGSDAISFPISRCM